MKKAFVKGYKAGARGAGASADPYHSSAAQSAQWTKGWASAFVDKEIDGKARRRIPKSF